MRQIVLNVEIDHGKIVVKGPGELPDKTDALLIIKAPPLTQPRPIGLAKGDFIVPDDFNKSHSEF